MGLQLPGQMPIPQPGVQIAAPLNDTQLVAIIAAIVNGPTIGDRVSEAQEIVAEACVQAQNLPSVIRQRQAARIE